MKKLTLIATAALVAGLVSASSAQYPHNGYLGIYGDAAGTQCCITAPAFASTTVYLISTLADSTANGVTGVEFRIEVSPAPTGSYFLTWNANPGLAVSLGSPLDDTPGDPNDAKGCNLAFAACQPTTPGERITWGTFSLLNIVAPPGTAPALTLKVKQKTPVSNPNRKCPLFVLCDAPVYTAVNMTLTQDALGGEEPVAFTAYINTPGCSACGPVAVAPATWSGVKELFR
jgi:hypothetical protein